MGRKPLEGVRVLDLTQAYSGPFCTMQLADFGAEVIKIERRLVGDQTRGWGPMHNGHSGYYAYINRNKEGMTLDLRSEEGKKVFLDLVKTADIVCENYKVGVMEKLSLGYDVLKEVNPRIIYGSISGFGLQGPLAKRPAYDIVAQAMSGMMSITGFPDAPPTKIGPSMGDNFSGAFLCMGVLMALYEREKTGVGRRLDIAMLDTLFSVMENFVIQYTIDGKIPMRNGNADPSLAPFDSFHAKDGDFVMGTGVDDMFVRLSETMGRPELSKDPRFVTNIQRCYNYHELKPEIEKWTMTKTVAELEEIIVGIQIPFGHILNIGEAAEHPQIKARNMLWKVYQPGMDEEITFPGTPIKMHGLEDKCDKAAPLLGEDNETILRRVLGYSDEKIAQLKKDEII